jgi:hypothetical protein
LLTAGPRSTLLINEFEFNTTTEEGSLLATLLKGTLSVVTGLIAKQAPEKVRSRRRTWCSASGAPSSSSKRVEKANEALRMPLRAVLALSLAACARLSDRVVLLPGPEGRSGALLVTAADGEVVLSEPYTGVDVAGGKVSITEDQPTNGAR